MRESDHLERALADGLNRVHAAARPPDDAWERFARRFDSHPTTPSDGYGATTSIEPAPEPSGHDRRRWLLPAVAAATVAIIIAGLALVIDDDSIDRTPVDTSPATAPDSIAVAPVPATTSPPETSIDTATTAPAPTTEPAPTPQSAPSTVPTQTRPPDESAAVVPLVQSSETRASPVGDITWTRVEGDGASLPQSVDFEFAGRFYGSDYDGTSWRSEDRITWTEIDPLPGNPSGYVEAGDDVWTALDPERLGEFPRLGRWDGTVFVPVDLPDITPPEVSGLRASTRLVLVPLGGELAIIASTTYRLDPKNDMVEFGIDVDMTDVAIEWVDDATMRIWTTFEGSAHQIGPDFTVAADPDQSGALQILSPDGMVVGRVGPWPGLGAEQFLQQLRLNGATHQQILIGGSSGFDTIAPPQPNDVISGLVDVDGRLLVLMDSSPFASDGYSLWASDDLAEWNQVELPEPAGIRIPAMDLHGNGRAAVINMVSEPPQEAQAWFTDDGQTWQPADAATSLHLILAAEFGWVMVRDGIDENRVPAEFVTVSADGITWQDNFPLEPDSSAGGRFYNVAANTIFLSKFADGGDRTIWIGVVND